MSTGAKLAAGAAAAVCVTAALAALVSPADDGPLAPAAWGEGRRAVGAPAVEEETVGLVHAPPATPGTWMHAKFVDGAGRPVPGVRLTWQLVSSSSDEDGVTRLEIPDESAPDESLETFVHEGPGFAAAATSSRPSSSSSGRRCSDGRPPASTAPST